MKVEKRGGICIGRQLASDATLSHAAKGLAVSILSKSAHEPYPEDLISELKESGYIVEDMETHELTLSDTRAKARGRIKKHTPEAVLADLMCKAWNEKMGGHFPFTRMRETARRLLVLCPNQDDILASFGKYMEEDGKFATPERFLSRFGLFNQKRETRWTGEVA